MKLRLFTYTIKISKQFKSTKAIIPIGCDCHPAYMLDKLKLRQKSLPFDWLDTEPLLAVKYAFENINNNFEFFAKNLKTNKEGKVFASKYPEALFYHFDDLITNTTLQKKVDVRIKRLLSIVRLTPCYYIHNTKSNAFKTEQEVDSFVKTISSFTTLLKPKDELLIYLRYDETLEENQLNCELLIRSIQPIKSCKIITYIKHEKKYGIWGDETKYKALIKTLGIHIKWKFPKIELLKE